MIYDPIASIDWDKFKKKLNFLCPTFKYTDDESLKLIIETYLSEIMDIGDIDIYPVKRTQEFTNNNTNIVNFFSFPVAQVDKITPLMDDSTELTLPYILTSRFLEFKTNVSDVRIYYTTQMRLDTFQRLIVNDLLYSYINYRSKSDVLEGAKSLHEGSTTITYRDDNNNVSNNSFVLERLKNLRNSHCRTVFF